MTKSKFNVDGARSIATIFILCFVGMGCVDEDSIEPSDRNYDDGPLVAYPGGVWDGWRVTEGWVQEVSLWHPQDVGLKMLAGGTVKLTKEIKCMKFPQFVVGRPSENVTVSAVVEVFTMPPEEVLEYWANTEGSPQITPPDCQYACPTYDGWILSNRKSNVLHFSPDGKASIYADRDMTTDAVFWSPPFQCHITTVKDGFGDFLLERVFTFPLD
jgi:hypothetical protein